MGRLKVAWITDFPVESLPGVADEIRKLARYNATWQRVLLDEIKQEVDLQVLALRKEISANQSFLWEGVTFHLIKVPGGIRAPSLFWIDTALLRPLLRKLQPDVVHAWGTERGAGLVAQRLGYPYVITIQGLFTWYREQIPLNRYERFAAWLEDRTLPKAPLVTTESVFAVNFLEKRFPGLRVRQAEHAPNWMFHKVQRKPQTAPLRIVFVGSFGYRKGADILVETLDRLQNEFQFELRVLGSLETGLIDALKKKTSPEIWSRLVLRNHLPPEEVAAELAQATLMIFPTRADTSPNAVKEAVVAGLPVAGSRVGGIPDYVFPDKNGVLFEPDSVEACVKATRRALQDPLLSQGKVDESTLRKVREYLSPKVMSARFLSAYREVLHG